MSPEDPRHGTVSGYNRIPCREACCREAYTAYRKRRDWDAANGRPRIVPTLGTRRRVQALARLGWAQAEVARRAGMHPEHLPIMLRKDTIRATTAERIAAVYEALSMTLPPAGHSASYARNHAQRHGWPPPLAWDDIDNPDEQPTGWRYASTDRATAIRDLADMGHGLAEVCRRLKVSPESLERWLQRHGMHDVYRQLAGRENAVFERRNQWTSEAS